MTNNLRNILLVLPVCAVAQKPLRGVVVSHPVRPDSVLVVNKSKHIYAYTDNKGNFLIAAAVRDTLVLSATNYRDQQVVVAHGHFDEPLVVNLESVANALEEVIVNRYQLTGDLSKDSKNIIVEEEFKIDVDFANLPEQSIDNERGDINFSVMPVMQSQLSGVNFVMIGGMVVDMLGIGGNDAPAKKEVDFVANIGERFSDEYIARIAQIDENQIVLFLNYCDANKPTEVDILEPANQMDLIAFLLAKADEFRKL